MLQQLRDKAKSFVSFALLILLVLSFGIWGIGDIFRNQ
ncbi:MAG TPA: SurA N-terminal domain-containing protein, partial [Alphaproteobacteria bacterium]|nr:SurA N-terminal domain-containing protein [Alphaproteobacteria bacterium]